MRNHNQKTRDITRSILPSRKSVSVDRRLVHKAVRQHNREVLQDALQDLDGENASSLAEAYPAGPPFPDLEDRAGPYLEPQKRGPRGTSIRQIVQRRRGADKTSQFRRWVESHTRGMSRDQALAYLRSKVPSNTIGRHALEHARSYIPDQALDNYGRPIPPSTYDPARAQAQSYQNLDAVRRLLQEVARFHLGDFNRISRAAYFNVRDVPRAKMSQIDYARHLAMCGPFRPLRGLHDVPAYMDWFNDKTFRLSGAVMETVCQVLEGSHHPDLHVAGRPVYFATGVVSKYLKELWLLKK